MHPLSTKCLQLIRQSLLEGSSSKGNTDSSGQQADALADYNGDPLLLVTDIQSTGDPASNISSMPLAGMLYGMSVAVCMSSALSEPGGAGLGTVGFHEVSHRQRILVRSWKVVACVADSWIRLPHAPCPPYQHAQHHINSTHIEVCCVSQSGLCLTSHMWYVEQLDCRKWWLLCHRWVKHFHKGMPALPLNQFLGVLLLLQGVARQMSTAAGFSRFSQLNWEEGGMGFSAHYMFRP